jgi:carbon storage regulator
MLVLSRKSGERVLVGGDVEVVVLEVNAGRVKLGFSAPRHVPIFRAEVHQEPADNLAAAVAVQPLAHAEESSRTVRPLFCPAPMVK